MGSSSKDILQTSLVNLPKSLFLFVTIWLIPLVSLAEVNPSNNLTNIPSGCETNRLHSCAIADNVQSIPDPGKTLDRIPGELQLSNFPPPATSQTSPSNSPGQPAQESKPDDATSNDRKQTQPNSPATPNQSEPLIPIKRIVVTGSTIFSEARLAELTAPLTNKSVKLTQLRELADKITQLYQENNFITSRAILPADQDVSSGVITIQVLEGSLERIDIKRAGGEGGRLAESYVRDRLAQGITTPLNFARLEDELQLLRGDPLIADIKANLAAGSKPATSILQVTFTEAKSFNVGALFDNYGNPATGIYRGGVTLQELNLTGIGDRISANYIRSGSSNSYGADYQLPLNPQGGTLGFNFSAGQNPITEAPFNTLNIKTESVIYEISYRQPLFRNPRQEFALSLGTAIETSNSFLDGRSFNFQTNEFDDGRAQSTVIRFGQDFISRDFSGAWAFRSTFNLGINALGATIRNNAPDGNFFYWTGQALRVQRLGNDRDTLALLRLGVQLTGDSLPPLSQFSIGGPQSVRGYSQNLLTGDSGIQGSLEFQLPIARDGDGTSLLKLLPFIDAGSVWFSNGRISEGIPQTLIGIGTGLLWTPSRGFSIRIDYGIPLVKINNLGSNLQNAGLYFSINANL